MKSKAETRGTTLVWLRRDLRLQDNAALFHALKAREDVLPLFIFDTNILGALEDLQDARVEFIHSVLSRLKQELEGMGSSILILHGNPKEIFKDLNPAAVYTNHDYEPYARQRDDEIRLDLERRGIAFHSFKDHVIFEKNEVLKDDGSPYTVFTPYSRKWKSLFSQEPLLTYPTSKLMHRLKRVAPIPMPLLKEIGFVPSGITIPGPSIPTNVITHYHESRDFPGRAGTSRLGIHLRFGTLSIRELARVASQTNETFLNELIWREFFQMILWHFPHVAANAFKPAYDHIKWRNDTKEFKAWCAGQTGYPIVDAGMRELNATGFMHNRLRMIAASFLTKHLLIDWRWGEAYFASKLLDFDLAANNGGWQWAAGSGCDAAPYFRIFNPDLQTAKFDPDHTYIRKWVPEYNTDQYPRRIVDHEFARKRVLEAYGVVKAR